MSSIIAFVAGGAIIGTFFAGPVGGLIGAIIGLLIRSPMKLRC